MLVLAYLLSLAIKGVVKIAIGLNFMLLPGVIWYILLVYFIYRNWLISDYTSAKKLAFLCTLIRNKAA
ncbi:hypothetical protein XBKB1_1810002 [Xenorhabdus bovienii str. kraussei Becker Underwood]|uniref:Uncharacterized protein n=1 Tax=Xenorhabdus bovienii str. kraussei Becker Underwood TaxID=1398204 RepID=A0A077PGQ6_XENBV|nr:hypothetical protein XBKB1_1810002 [Xenorhabdus bovienii str. kraussei Becker Underwood]